MLTSFTQLLQQSFKQKVQLGCLPVSSSLPLLTSGYLETKHCVIAFPWLNFCKLNTLWILILLWLVTDIYSVVYVPFIVDSHSVIHVDVYNFSLQVRAQQGYFCYADNAVAILFFLKVVWKLLIWWCLQKKAEESVVA